MDRLLPRSVPPLGGQLGRAVGEDLLRPGGQAVKLDGNMALGLDYLVVRHVRGERLERLAALPIGGRPARGHRGEERGRRAYGEQHPVHPVEAPDHEALHRIEAFHESEHLLDPPSGPIAGKRLSAAFLGGAVDVGEIAPGLPLVGEEFDDEPRPLREVAVGDPDGRGLHPDGFRLARLGEVERVPPLDRGGDLPNRHVRRFHRRNRVFPRRPGPDHPMQRPLRREPRPFLPVVAPIHGEDEAGRIPGKRVLVLPQLRLEPVRFRRIRAKQERDRLVPLGDRGHADDAVALPYRPPLDASVLDVVEPLERLPVGLLYVAFVEGEEAGGHGDGEVGQGRFDWRLVGGHPLRQPVLDDVDRGALAKRAAYGAHERRPRPHDAVHEVEEKLGNGPFGAFAKRVEIRL